MESSEAGSEESDFWENVESAINALAQLFMVALAGLILARLGFLASEEVKKAISNVGGPHLLI